MIYTVKFTSAFKRGYKLICLRNKRSVTIHFYRMATDFF